MVRSNHPPRTHKRLTQKMHLKNSKSIAVLGWSALGRDSKAHGADGSMGADEGADVALRAAVAEPGGDLGGDGALLHGCGAGGHEAARREDAAQRRRTSVPNFGGAQTECIPPAVPPQRRRAQSTASAAAQCQHSCNKPGTTWTPTLSPSPHWQPVPLHGHHGQHHLLHKLGGAARAGEGGGCLCGAQPGLQQKEGGCW